MTLFPTV